MKKVTLTLGALIGTAALASAQGIAVEQQQIIELDQEIVQLTEREVIPTVQTEIEAPIETTRGQIVEQTKVFGHGTLPQFLQKYDLNQDGILSIEEKQAIEIERPSCDAGRPRRTVDQYALKVVPGRVARGGARPLLEGPEA